MENLLEFIESASPQEVAGEFTPEAIQYIANRVTPSQLIEILFAKNCKIFGGINGYINDVFAKNTVQKIQAMPEGIHREKTASAFLVYLWKMELQNETSAENHERLEEAIQILETCIDPQVAAATRAAAEKQKAGRTLLQGQSAPAAGGRRKREKKQKRLTRQRRRVNASRVQH